MGKVFFLLQAVHITSFGRIFHFLCCCAVLHCCESISSATAQLTPARRWSLHYDFFTLSSTACMRVERLLERIKNMIAIIFCQWWNIFRASFSYLMPLFIFRTFFLLSFSPFLSPICLHAFFRRLVCSLKAQRWWDVLHFVQLHTIMNGVHNMQPEKKLSESKAWRYNLMLSRCELKLSVARCEICDWWAIGATWEWLSTSNYLEILRKLIFVINYQ